MVIIFRDFSSVQFRTRRIIFACAELVVESQLLPGRNVLPAGTNNF